MNIISELNKHNIIITIKDDNYIFTFPTKEEKTIHKNELEEYLFLCLMNFINIKK